MMFDGDISFKEWIIFFTVSSVKLFAASIVTGFVVGMWVVCFKIGMGFFFWLFSLINIPLKIG